MEKSRNHIAFDTTDDGSVFELIHIGEDIGRAAIGNSMDVVTGNRHDRYWCPAWQLQNVRYLDFLVFSPEGMRDVIAYWARHGNND